MGYVPELDSGLALAAGLAALFAGLQLAHMAFTSLAAPHRGTLPLLFETLSNAAALTLLPFLAGFSVINWGIQAAGVGHVSAVQRVLQKLDPALLEPALLGGAFLAVHCAFKLLSFFAATQAPSPTRVATLGWIAATIVAIGGSATALDTWRTALREAQSLELPAEQQAAVGGVVTGARPLAMGATYTFDFAGRGGQNAIFRVAYVPQRREREMPQSLHAQVQLRGANNQAYQTAIPLEERDWSEFRVLPDALPVGIESLELIITPHQEAAWIQYTGVRPVAASSGEVLVAGPFFARPRGQSRDPNFVLIAVDALGSARLKSQGNLTESMPAFEALTKSGVFFPSAFTPAPEVASAAMSLLTGLSPLEHGILGTHGGPLPSDASTLAEQLRARGFATAAFAEAESEKGQDLAPETGFARGFDLYNPETPIASAQGSALPGTPAKFRHGGSAVTAKRAMDWIEGHAQDDFFVFLRLREAASSARGNGEDNVPAGLHQVDREIGAIVDRLRSLGLLADTVVTIVGLNGVDVDAGTPQERLAEHALRVPIVMLVPGLPARTRTSLVSLEDVVPTLLRQLSPPVEAGRGRELLSFSGADEVISMIGAPFTLSLRDRRFRFVWQAGQDPFSRAPQGAEASLALIDLDQLRYRGVTEDVLRKRIDEAERYRERLLRYIEAHKKSQSGAMAAP